MNPYDLCVDKNDNLFVKEKKTETEYRKLIFKLLININTSYSNINKTYRTFRSAVYLKFSI